MTPAQRRLELAKIGTIFVTMTAGFVVTALSYKEMGR